MKHRSTLATLSLIAVVGMPALGQSRSQRVEQLSSMLVSSVEQDNTVYVDTEGQPVATPRQLMRELIAVDLNAIPARQALEIWSTQTGVSLVASWQALENEGIDLETPVTLQLSRIPAEQALRLIVQQMHPDPIGDDKLIIDIEQWYVRLMTRGEALRQSETRMYFIGDLLMDIPNFTNAPQFDLNEALSNTNSGGSNGGGGGGNQQPLFGDENNNGNNQEAELTKEEKAERIADVIRDTIEPDIWDSNGGQYASIRYFRGMLVVKAPAFVHEQIGVPVQSETRRTARATSRDRGTTDRSSNPNAQRPRSTSGNVSGTAPSGPRMVR